MAWRFRLPLILGAVVGGCTGSEPPSPGEVRSTVDSATVRLPPSDFVALPPAIRQDLEGRGCLVPQPASLLMQGGSPHNVVSGAFTGPERVDWAVLCSVRDTSRILVYRAGAAVPADSLARTADRLVLQRLDDGVIGYSRLLSPVGGDYIRRMATEFDGPAPPPDMDHQGIDDAFVGKASVVHYFHAGRWLPLQGID